ncbi:MAG TPA: hypothetical protein VLA84_06330 [Microcoleus sp.]|nr:hypothetical protein [Microcoleus sp.]
MTPRINSGGKFYRIQVVYFWTDESGGLYPGCFRSPAKQVGDFLDRQMHHRLKLNKSSPQLMSAIAAKFDLAFQALPYPWGTLAGR